MIDDTKIIVATTLSNAILTGYYPTCIASISSWANSEYVDEVMIAEGFSEDETVSEVKKLSEKVNVVSEKLWPLNKWNWQNLYDQYDLLYKVCRNRNEKLIMIYLSSDQVFTSNFRHELYNALKQLVRNDKKDFFLLPFLKTINYEFITCPYGYEEHFHLHSALKFDKKERRWLGTRGPEGLESSRGESFLINENNPKVKGENIGRRLYYNFKSFPICYDMFMFTVENLNHKIQRYGRSFDGPAVIYGEGEAWPEKYQDYLGQIWLRKTLNLRPTKIPFSFHPIEMRHVMSDYLDETRFGYNCFEMLAQEVRLGIRSK